MLSMFWLDVLIATLSVVAKKIAEKAKDGTKAR